MVLKSYVPTAIIAILASFNAIVSYGFIISNQRIPDASAFSLNTIGYSSSATLLALTAFLVSIPRFKQTLYDKGLSSMAYTGLVAGTVLVSIILVGVAILSGSAEFTQFQSIAN